MLCYVTGCYVIIFFTTAKTYLLSSSEYFQWNENQNTIHGLTHDINSMPKLLYTWYFEKFTASVISSGHSALRHEVSRICTILVLGCVNYVNNFSFALCFVLCFNKIFLYLEIAPKMRIKI